MNAQNQFRPGTWLEKIHALGQEVFESKSNKEIAAMIGCDNPGRVSQDRKTVSEKTGWAMPVGRGASSPATTTTAQPSQATKPRKQSGSLPAKIQGFLEGIVEEIPDTWKPANVFPVIEEDSVGWNRFVRRMADIDADMVASFEKWLGSGATLSRQGAFDAVLEAAANWDRKARAIALAESLIALGFGDKTPSALVREFWV